MNPDLVRRLEPTGQLLIRSITEVSELLEEMREAGALVTAQAGEEVLFLSRLLEIDAAGGHLVVACSDHAPANLALLAAPEVRFSCNHRSTHFEFSAAQPRAAEYGSMPAIQLKFPAGLIALQRRAQRRYVVPPEVPLRCEIQLGALSFDVRIIDISLNGVGAILFDAGIRLERGTRLERSRIRHPELAPVVVDLEVLHVCTVELPDGRLAKRAGCRFSGAEAEIEKLIRLFVTELEPDPEIMRPWRES